MMTYEGLVKYIESQREDNPSKKAQKWANQFVRTTACPECNGTRLKKESLWFKIDGKEYFGDCTNGPD
jgi:excinuclease ABC subunit A